MKADYDMCEAVSECESANCINGRCISKEVEVTNAITMEVLIIMVILMLIIVIATCCYAKVKVD